MTGKSWTIIGTERRKYRTGYEMVLPREAIEGNEEAKEMLETVWDKILEDKEHSLSNGFGRVVHMDSDTLDKIKAILNAKGLSKEAKLENIKNILKDLEYEGKKEFGSGKGIFRVSDIHSDSVGGIMAELRIDGSTNGRVVIMLKTDKDPEVFMPEKHYELVKNRWHWPYTGTGFIPTRNGEILPEYYLNWMNKEGQMPEGMIRGIKLITSDGGECSLGW